MNARYILVALSTILILAVTAGVSRAWVENGDTICVSTNGSTEPKIVADGLGGSIVVWCDKRGTHTCVYAQRVGPRGNLLWNSAGNEDGIAVCDTLWDQSDPCVISDNAGGAIIAWLDRRGANWDIYAMKINADGTRETTGPHWQPNGIPICMGSWSKQFLNMVSDGFGGVIISWDEPNYPNYHVVSAQRIAGNGECKWNLNGNDVAPSIGVDNHSLIPDGSGGAYVASQWFHTSIGNGIRVARINADGVVLWQIQPETPCGNNNYDPQLIRSGGNGVMVVWWGGTSTHMVVAARITELGSRPWPNKYIVIRENTTTCARPQIAEDGTGGGIVVWEDNNSTDSDIYAQRVDINGALQWGPSGVAVCNLPYNQDSPQIASDGNGGAFAAWHDNRNSYFEIFAQCLNHDGGICPGTENGIPVCNGVFGNQRYPKVASVSPGNAVVVWIDPRDGESNCAIFGSMISTDPTCRPLETLLQHFSSESCGNSIRVNWTLAEKGRQMQFHVYRSNDNGEFQKLAGVGIIEDHMSFLYEDRDLLPSTSYVYRVDVSDEAGYRMLFETDPVLTPKWPVTLNQNHPNPFNPSTAISYYLPESSLVKLEIFDVSGRSIVCLVNREQEMGTHAIEWKGMDARGIQVASGVYFYRLEAGKQSSIKKMILLR